MSKKELRKPIAAHRASPAERAMRRPTQAAAPLAGTFGTIAHVIAGLLNADRGRAVVL